MLTCFPAPAPYRAGIVRCEGERINLSIPTQPDGATWLSQDWGDVPTWCAVVAAVAAAIYAARAYRLERGRDIAAERIQLQSQANNVAFWIEEDTGWYEIFYNNATNQVVEKTVFEIVDVEDGQVLDKPFELGPLRPGKSDSLCTAIKVYPHPVALRATFRDAQGISWTRFKGELEPERGAEQPTWWKSLTVDWERLLLAPIPAVSLAMVELTRDVSQLMVVATRLVGVTVAGATRLVGVALAGFTSVVGQSVAGIVRAVGDLFRRR